MAELDILLLRSFIAVARSGSMRAAAQRVGRTQSAVSLQIKRLEAIVGEPLFHRMGSGVAITAAGERLMASAERILTAHDEALAAIRKGGLRGAVSFGCPEDYLTAYFPELLRDFARDNPDIELEIVSAPSVELRPLLRRRRLDLAMVSFPADMQNEDVFRHEQFVWIANNPAPPLLQEPVVPLAMSAPDTLDHRAARAALDQAGRAYRIAYASNGLAGLLAVARSGQAISIVTRSAVPPDLHILDHGLPVLAEIGVGLVYATSPPPPTARTFGNFIRHHLGMICAGTH